MNKYVIIELINTLGEYQTGNKYITFNFFNVLFNLGLDKYDLLVKAMNKFEKELLIKVDSIYQEYDKLRMFYTKVLDEISYDSYSDKDIDIITRSLVDNVHKITYYDRVYDYLERLSEKYKIILLVDDFPSIINSLEYHNYDKYIDKVYITSCYGVNGVKELFKMIRNNYKDYVYINSYNQLVGLVGDNYG